MKFDQIKRCADLPPEAGPILREARDVLEFQVRYRLAELSPTIETMRIYLKKGVALPHHDLLNGDWLTLKQAESTLMAYIGQSDWRCLAPLLPIFWELFRVY